MPDQFSPGQLQEIQTVIVDLCQQNKIPFFVFSCGFPLTGLVKQVITFTGQPNDQGTGYDVNITIDNV